MLVASSATAAGYDDFVRGLSDIHELRFDLAVASFTKALDAGDLSESLVPVAYVERAYANAEDGNCTAAIDDTTAALKFDVNRPEAFYEQGMANLCIGANEKAEEDFSHALSLRQSDAAFAGRGRAQWGIGNFEVAAADFANSAELAPRNPYYVLWLAISRLRMGTPNITEATRNIDDLNESGWPKPILDFYIGRTSADEVFRFANTGTADLVSGKRCEADFYIAEWWILVNDFRRAVPLLHEAQTDCPKNYIEKFAATVELKRVK